MSISSHFDTKPGLAMNCRLAEFAFVQVFDSACRDTGSDGLIFLLRRAKSDKTPKPGAQLFTPDLIAD
jgi:hypothetical protein